MVLDNDTEDYTNLILWTRQTAGALLSTGWDYQHPTGLAKDLEELAGVIEKLSKALAEK